MSQQSIINKKQRTLSVVRSKVHAQKLNLEKSLRDLRAKHATCVEEIKRLKLIIDKPITEKSTVLNLELAQSHWQYLNQTLSDLNKLEKEREQLKSQIVEFGQLLKSNSKETERIKKKEKALLDERYIDFNKAIEKLDMEIQKRDPHGNYNI